MKKRIFFLPLAGILLSGCGLINETMRAMENNTCAIYASTQAICENIQAIQAANESIEENRRELEGINKQLEEASKS